MLKRSQFQLKAAAPRIVEKSAVVKQIQDMSTRSGRMELMFRCTGDRRASRPKLEPCMKMGARVQQDALQMAIAKADLAGRRASASLPQSSPTVEVVHRAARYPCARCLGWSACCTSLRRQ